MSPAENHKREQRTMTRVAFVTPYLPWPPDNGGKLRSYYLLRGLASSAEVDLYTVYHEDPPDAGAMSSIVHSLECVRIRHGSDRWAAIKPLFTKTPRSVRYFQTPASLDHMRTRLAAGYDLHVCDEIVMVPYCRPLSDAANAPRLIMRQKVDHAHYLEMAAARKWGREKVLDWLEGRRLAAFERGSMPLFAAATVCSEADRVIIRDQMAPGAPVEVLVNGADTEYFKPQRTPDAQPTVLLLGTMHYYPNVDATLYFFNEMYEALRQAVPDIRILVVGHNPPPEITALSRHPGVTVTGSVPDVRPYMARSWVMAVPLRLGGGTRLKIMEAMASALPIVSTVVGAEGTGVTDGQQLLVADTPQRFVEQTVRLLGDAGLRGRLAAQGLEYVTAHCSWQALGARFAKFCLDVAAHRGQGGPDPLHSSEGR